MGEKLPKWESELWSYVRSGHGEHCPIYSYCHVRMRGGWCPGNNVKCIHGLLDDKQFNFSKYDWIKGGETCRVFQLVERLTQKYLKMGNVHSPSVPTVLVGLVDPRRTVEIRMVPLTTYHAGVWCLKGSWIVQLNENDPPALRRFSLFHEAFHILAHCKTTPKFRKRGAMQGAFNELLANYFAGCLLMPREWVKEKWAQVHDIDEMAEIFDVPKSLMWIRLREFGLL